MTQRKITAIAIFGAALLGAPNALAQSECADVLRAMPYNETVTFSKSDELRQARYFICREDVTTFYSARDVASSLGIGIDIFKLDFGSRKAETNFKEWKSALCSDQLTFENLSNSQKTVVRTVAARLESFLESCIGKGVKLWISRVDSEGTTFILNAYFGRVGGLTKVPVESFIVDGATCQPGLATIKELNPGVALTCKRPDAHVAATAVINAHGESTATMLEAEPRVDAEKESLKAQVEQLSKELEARKAEIEKLKFDAEAVQHELKTAKDKIARYEGDLYAKGYEGARTNITWAICRDKNARKRFLQKRTQLGQTDFTAIISGSQSHNPKAQASIANYGERRTLRFIGLELAHCIP